MTGRRIGLLALSLLGALTSSCFVGDEDGPPLIDPARSDYPIATGKWHRCVFEDAQSEAKGCADAMIYRSRSGGYVLPDKPEDPPARYALKRIARRDKSDVYLAQGVKARNLVLVFVSRDRPAFVVRIPDCERLSAADRARYVRLGVLSRSPGRHDIGCAVAASADRALLYSMLVGSLQPQEIEYHRHEEEGGHDR